MTGGVTVKNGITPELEQLAAQAEDMSPAMRKIERRLLAPSIYPAWSRSGLRQKTGELRKAVAGWHGKKSAGITLKTRPGKDLVLPKAHMHMSGKEKHQHKKKDDYKLRSKKGKTFKRKNLGAPWGNVQARPFLPEANRLRAHQDKMAELIKKYLLEGK